MSKTTTYLQILDRVSQIIKDEMKEYDKFTPKQKVRSALTDVNNYILFRGKLNKASMSSKPVSEKETSAWQVAELANMERAKTKIKTFGTLEYQLYIDALKKKIEELQGNASATKRLDVFEYISVATSFCQPTDPDIMQAITELRANNSETLSEGMLK